MPPPEQRMPGLSMRSTTENRESLPLPSETILRILRNHCGHAAGLEETLDKASKHIITGLQLFRRKKDRSQVVKAILMSLDLPLRDGAVLGAMATAIASEVHSVKSMVRVFPFIRSVDRINQSFAQYTSLMEGMPQSVKRLYLNSVEAADPV